MPISSVVLSSQRVDLKDALYNAAKNKEEPANPLVEDGWKLIPSVTRVFSKARSLYVYLQAYQQGAAGAQPLIAFVSLYRDQKKAFESKPIEVREGADNRLRTMSLGFTIGLTGLPSGRYDCQVTVLDPNARKAAFWQAPIVLVP